MADSTSNITQISSSQASKEVTANALFDAASLAMLYGRNALTTTGLTWGFYGGRIYVNGVATAIANSTVALTLSQTNYVEVSIAGAVTANTTGFSADKAPLYKVVTGASTITSYEDHRNEATFRKLFYARSTLAMADANKTLTHAQAVYDSIECTGALTALRDVVVPTVRRQWIVYANTTGGFGVRFKTSAGTGITVADGARAILECDGTNVISVNSQSIAGVIPIAAGGTGASTARGAMAALKGVYILAASGVAASVTGTLVKTTLATITLPGGALGANGVLRITPLWTYTNSANTKTLEITVGGVAFQAATPTTTGMQQTLIIMRNAGATNSQKSFSLTNAAGVAVVSSAMITAAVDTSVDQSIVFSGTLTNTGETITLEGYLVEVIVP